MTGKPLDRHSERAAKAEIVRQLREVEGLKWREIGERLGCSRSMALDLYDDPTGEKARERKRRFERQCIGCGKTINPNGHRPEVVRCLKCHGEHTRAMQRRWILESIEEWADANGGIPPVIADWSPAHARLNAQDWRIRRMEATGRTWPSHSSVADHFGSWPAGIEAAGFEAFKAGQYGRENEDVCRERLDEITARYEAGESSVEIADDLGVCGESVRWWLRRAGVSLRSQSEAQRLRWARDREAA